MGKRVVIIGASFAGLAAAFELKRTLGGNHDIRVLSSSAEFVFLPSLIWLPFGERKPEDIAFELAPLFAQQHIDFEQVIVEELDLDSRKIYHSSGITAYDYLILAPGASNAYGAVPGLGPFRGHTHSIFGLKEAELARPALERLLEMPGPVLVGAAPGAAQFSATYEFLFNLELELNKRGLREYAPITLVTPEPYAGHFGSGGLGESRRRLEAMLKERDIEVIADAAITRAGPGCLELDDGRRLEFAFAMIAPPQAGPGLLHGLPRIIDARGFVNVDETYRTLFYPEVLAAGQCVALTPPEPTRVPCGVACSGLLSDQMGRIAAQNVAAMIEAQPLVEEPVAALSNRLIVDAGETGVILSPGWQLRGPEAHWAKVALEKYFLGTRKRGWR